MSHLGRTRAACLQQGILALVDIPERPAMAYGTGPLDNRGRQLLGTAIMTWEVHGVCCKVPLWYCSTVRYAVRSCGHGHGVLFRDGYLRNDWVLDGYCMDTLWGFTGQGHLEQGSTGHVKDAWTEGYFVI